MKLIAIVLFVLLCSGDSAVAHEGEDHAAAPGSESTAGANEGPIEVSEIAQRNLGLLLQEAELRPVETTLRAIGEIVADPRLSGSVSSRIAGRVSGVFAQEGEQVAKGRPLVEVESLQLGDPPPRARYASPVTGTVTDRHVVVGDDVEPNRHLFEIADLSEVLAIGRVFEGQIGQVSVGQKVRVRVPSYPDAVFEGVVERLGGTLDPASRSLAVYVRVRNGDGRLRPHMRATLSLITGGSALALAIPKSAVLGEAGHFFAFVQDEERPERFARRALVLGVSDDRFIEVVDGLAPGERVVVEGNYSLQYVTPVADPEGSEAAPASETRAETGAPTVSGRATALWVGAAMLVVVAAVLGARVVRQRSRPVPEAR